MRGLEQIQRGILLAALAALLFGAAVPVLKLASAAAGPWVSVSLLYFGAAAGAGGALAVRRRRIRGELLKSRALLRLVAVALLGAVCAPVLLIVGMKRADAATVSLLLTLEVPFTLLLARLFFNEHLGRRALTAAIVVFCGSLLLAGRLPAGDGSIIGLAAVGMAGVAWALDNVVSRTLADYDPLGVVALKGLVGALISGGLAALSGESLPSPGAVAGIFSIGAVGYGLSLQLYLGSQTLVGAARTASVFAAAPFAGTALAFFLGSPWPGWHFPIAAGLLLAGVGLHISERHGHAHKHEPIVHEHLHTHDDGHHVHVHSSRDHQLSSGAHSHLHEHPGITHEHEHGDDIHHRHQH